MAKKEKRISKRNKTSKESVSERNDGGQQNQEKFESERLTLAALDAISDDDDDGADLEESEEWNAEAKALRQAIAEGAFNKLELKPSNENTKNNFKKMDLENKNKSDETVEVVLEDDSSEEGNDLEKNGLSDEEVDEKNQNPVGGVSNTKALKSVAAELMAEKLSMPWAETFNIVPPTPLPFGVENDQGITPLDIHDDLKRELAFYNVALEAVHEARKECEKSNIPFTRPEDFFAEMVKNDVHMAKVKDRLIFETKKMEAFEQRKANREQKLRSKEKHAHRIAEKSKAKKNHMKEVEEWAKNAASNRLGGGKLRDDEGDFLNNMNNSGPNKKRLAADRKYGFGGKRGRFKQTDQKTLNDMSDYNPRGNFGGLGKKSASTGAKRKGKRARDASKSRR